MFKWVCLALTVLVVGGFRLEKKVMGSGLKEVMSAQEWVADARKEALWLTFRAKSRSEFLERLCENKFGSSWFIRFEGI